MNFGQNLKKLRKNAKLTQSQLAEKLGMKQNAYVLWEQKSTNPTLEILEKLADIYDLPIQELIKETDNNAEKQLIDNYRSLTGEQQESVINFTDFLIEQNKTEIINLKTYRRSSLDYAIVEDEELSAGFGQSQSNTGGHYKAYTSETLGRYDGAARVKGESMEPEFPNFSIATFFTRVSVGVWIFTPLLKEIWAKNVCISNKYLKKKMDNLEFIHSIQIHNTRIFI